MGKVHAHVECAGADKMRCLDPCRSARYLEENVVVEWRKVYINYRGLKKLIKNVDARRKVRLNRELARQPSKSSSTRRALTSTMSGLRPRSSYRDTGDDSGILSSGFSVGPNYGGMGNGAGLAEEVEEDPLPAVSLKGTGLSLLSVDSDFVRTSAESEMTKVSSGEEGSGSSGFKPHKRANQDVEANAMPRSTSNGQNGTSDSGKKAKKAKKPDKKGEYGLE